MFRTSRVDASHIWVHAAAGMLCRRATALGLDASNSRLTISLGNKYLESGPEYLRGVRGPTSADGIATLDAMRRLLWHDDSVEAGMYATAPLVNGHLLNGALGVYPGVLQLWDCAGRERRLIQNLWVPTLTVWRRHPVLRRLDALRALEAMESFDTLRRIDVAPYEIALDACGRL